MDTGDKNSINNIIMDCLRTGDMSNFNATVEKSVGSFLSDIEKTIQSVGEIDLDGRAKSMSSHFESYTKGSATDERMQKLNREKKERLEKEKQLAKVKAELLKKTAIKVPFVPVGEVSSVITTTFGGIGLAVSLIGIVTKLLSFLVGSATYTVLIPGALAAAFFGYLTNRGIIKKKRLVRAKRYASITGSRQYIGVKELSAATNQTERRALADFKKMLKCGFFPEGHIDADNTTLMFTDSVYDEYVRNVKERAAIGGDNIYDTTAKDVTDDGNSELIKMISEGNEYIATLHRLNEEIPGEVITEKLTRLENLLREIFTCVENHPEQMSRMHEVMNYYIPTVIKLVEAYKEYDGVTEAGDEIKDAKNQIEGSIDTINDALRKILNNLFRDSVWDVTTDASVLNTMLAQKGLVSTIKN